MDFIYYLPGWLEIIILSHVLVPVFLGIIALAIVLRCILFVARLIIRFFTYLFKVLSGSPSNTRLEEWENTRKRIYYDISVANEKREDWKKQYIYEQKKREIMNNAIDGKYDKVITPTYPTNEPKHPIDTQS